MKKILLTAILAASVILLLTCENGFNILDEVETEVKIANDKFLVIKSITPVDEGSGIDPGTNISITFDRALKMDSVTTNAIKIIEYANPNNEKSWLSPSFEELTKTLTLKTEGLDITTKYVISIDGLRGSDNSELQEEYIWSFTTGIAPAGSISLVSKNGQSQENYTDNNIVTADITGNNITEHYYISETKSVLEEPPAVADSGWEPISYSDSIDYNLNGSDGTKTVYILFRDYNEDSSTYVYSQIAEASITLDLIDPSVDAGTDKLVNSQTLQNATVTEVNVHSYEWTGTGLSFTSASNEDIYINASSDGTYTAQLTVTDKAGRTGSDTLTFTKDTEPPAGSSALIDGDANLSTDGLVDFQFTFSDNESTQTSCQYRIYDSENYYYSWVTATGSTITVPVTFSENYNYQTRYVYVQFQDEAGNISSLSAGFQESYDWIRIDNMPVSAPAVTFTDDTYTSGSLTLDSTPTWQWTSAGDGKQYFRYSFNESTWYYTYDKSYTPGSALSDGTYTLYVQEQDYDGSYSSSGSKYLRVTPVIPYDGQTNVPVLKGVTLAWRENSTLDTYDLQVYSGKIWTTIASGLTTNRYTVSGLSTSTTYQWRLYIHPFRGTAYYSPTFAFSSSSF